MLGFSFAARASASLLSTTLLVGSLFVSSDAAAQGTGTSTSIGSPIGLQTAYAGMSSRPWYADRPDYFNPFDAKWGDGKSWVNVYGGVIAKAELSSILFTGDFRTGDVGVVAASYAREFGSLGNAVRFEWEVGSSFHFGAETFASAHAYLVTRWIWFPWNHLLMTTFAVGTGPSIATKKSKYESEKGEASYYKNGFMMEFTFGLPEEPDWMLQARIHHRSSIFGVISKAGTPSDYLTIGIKHRF
jgi:hypothetical protein